MRPLAWLGIVAVCASLIGGVPDRAESRPLPRCLAPSCLIGTVMVELLIECIIKGDCVAQDPAPAAPPPQQPAEREEQAFGSGNDSHRPGPGRMTVCYRLRQCEPGRRECFVDDRRRRYCQSSNLCDWVTVCQNQ